MKRIFGKKPNETTPLVNYYIELNKGIIKTLKYTIEELPFYKYKRKRFLNECIKELEEYIDALKLIKTEE